jgi:hypothetical protein
MTTLLERAFAEAGKLSAAEQDLLASRLLAELEAEDKFDCVEMKRRAQELLRQEYESHIQEFPSYVDFLNAKAAQSPWANRLRQRCAEKTDSKP